MPNTYYDSELTGEQIGAALTAIDGVVTQENNGKVLAIENGKIVAKSASEWTDTPVLEPLNVIANGDYVPKSGVDGFSSVHVAVPGAGNIKPLSVTENDTYNPPSGVDGFAPVTVNVQGGGPVVSDNDILFHFNGDFRNSGSFPALFSSVDGLTISDEQSKFGGSSLKCGSTQIIDNVVLGAGFALGTEDFTLDFWCYPTNLSSSNQKVPISFTYRSLAVYLRTKDIEVCVAKSDSSWFNDGTVQFSFANNQWYHIAIVRDGTALYYFVDGVKVKTCAFGSDAFAPATHLTVGSNTYTSGDRRFQGYIDELRLKIGEAVWTSDFTPPTQPYV